MGEKLFTAKEAAEILKVRKNTVYDMIKRGDLKASKLGKQLRIRQEDLDFYIQYGSQAKVVDSMQTGHNSNIDKAEFVKNTFKQKIAEYKDLKLTFGGEVNKLFIPKDSKLIKTLTQVFNEITSKNEEPITIGGATFARAFPNCVSFGANMPHEKDLCHQADENIKIDNLIISAKIYANAIYKLMEE